MRTVYYASAESIGAALNCDLEQKKAFSYRGSTEERTVGHIAKFVSGLWQIHAFGEWNTRTTAVFAIKYLRTLGFEVTNDPFAEHSWYFRNALVRADRNDHKKGIYSTDGYLCRFFSDLMFGGKNVLRSRDLPVKSEK